MTEQLEDYRRILDTYHDVLKEKDDYGQKVEALGPTAYYTVLYLAEIYKEDDLYDYRSIETGAREVVTKLEENLQVANRYNEKGQLWRAKIALNSLGLDLFIIQSAAEHILTLSGKYIEDLPQSISSHKFYGILKKRLKKLQHHDTRSPAFSFDPIIRSLQQYGPSEQNGQTD
ncbi:MAG: hypothetical protein K9L66_11350 [Spirochaetaceae bacterium]|nr:hypothetical protein [Spirochaetaceae bacterium]MCF7949392.1 hypothetical protein [Spirochaetia bacterium]MCF7952118.1 hypothetical protein [Spirochaetaceae bacterium]